MVADPVATRAATLRRVADLYEENMGEFCAIATREAGKILVDRVAEVRRWSISSATTPARPSGWKPRIQAVRAASSSASARGTSLAIFTGQIAAALAAGNAVLAKPAEQTPIIAARAAQMFREVACPRPPSTAAG